jgi:hypothetical protein
MQVHDFVDFLSVHFYDKTAAGRLGRGFEAQAGAFFTKLSTESVGKAESEAGLSLIHNRRTFHTPRTGSPCFPSYKLLAGPFGR